jgi:hypothetical protein
MSTAMVLWLLKEQHLDENVFVKWWWALPSVAVVTGMLFLAGFQSKEVVEGKKNVEICYSLLSILVSIFVLVGLFMSVYVYFGTWYVWVPIFNILLFFLMMENDPTIEEFLEFVFNKENYSFVYNIVVCIGLVSLAYQFYLMPVWGIPMWMWYIGCISILVVVVFLIKKQYNASKQNAKT